MIGVIRWAVLLFLLLTVVYAILTFTNRSKQRDHLKDEYSQSDKSIELDEYMDHGMSKYNRSLKGKLVLGVYLFPLIVFCTLVYFAQL